MKMISYGAELTVATKRERTLSRRALRFVEIKRSHMATDPYCNPCNGEGSGSIDLGSTLSENLHPLI